MDDRAPPRRTDPVIVRGPKVVGTLGTGCGAGRLVAGQMRRAVDNARVDNRRW